MIIVLFKGNDNEQLRKQLYLECIFRFCERGMPKSLDPPSGPSFIRRFSMSETTYQIEHCPALDLGNILLLTSVAYFFRHFS
jgi:hypothetical protein